MKKLLTCLIEDLEFIIGVVLGVYIAVSLVLYREALLGLIGLGVVVMVLFNLLTEWIWRKE